MSLVSNRLFGQIWHLTDKWGDKRTFRAKPDRGLDRRIREHIRRMMVPSDLQTTGQLTLPGLPPPGAILIPQEDGSEEVVKLYAHATVAEHRRYVDKLWLQVEQDRLRAQDEEGKHLFYLERIAQLNLTPDATIRDLL